VRESAKSIARQKKKRFTTERTEFTEEEKGGRKKGEEKDNAETQRTQRHTEKL